MMDLKKEREALATLLRAHPAYGTRPLSIGQCLRHPAVPAALKARWQRAFRANYPDVALKYSE